jgi:protein ImuA
MPRDPHSPIPDRSPAPATRLVEGLRARIGAIERDGRGAWGTLPLGVAEIDRRLGGGLAIGALHEIVAVDAGAACAFAIAVAARAARRRDGAVLWCASPHTLEAGALYGPGLRTLGLDPARLIAVSAARDEAVLWAMEEGLRCPALAAVIGEAAEAGLTGTRRLQLAAGAGGVTALLLRPAAAAGKTSAAATRWRLATAPSRPRGFEAALGEPGAPCWRAELIRCRAGAPGDWVLEWCDETGDFALAAPLRDRPAGACAGGAAAGAVRAGA